MCGIAGIANKDRERPAARGDVIAMCDAIRHRGPDAAAYFTAGPLALGHRRLAILDLTEAGTQPMSTQDGRFTIVFNGEIYNYLELRDELSQRGVTFQTQTDTEVILEAYRAWGAECVHRFNGMWAFALHDRAVGSLFLSRDRFGIKPLYYLDDSDSFLFASEIKAILTVRPVERVPNWGVITRFIPSGVFADGVETFFKNIFSLPPAHNAVYDIDAGRMRMWRYWSVEAEQFAERWASKDPVGVLRELLQSSIKLHMRSDVPVGTCLSGGVDSSTMVCLMSRLRSDPVRTYSGIYRDRDCDEKQYVDAISRHVTTIPCAVLPEPAGDLLEDLRRITWHQDNPTAGPGLYTQYHVMRRASQDVKVILDGQGADELFGGYLHYFRPHLQDLVRTGLRGKAQALGVLAGMSWHWGTAIVPTSLKARIARLFGSHSAPVAGDALMDPALRAFGNGPAPGRAEFGRLQGHLNQALCDQLLNSSLPALLHYEDRNSMAFSIEARVPFLDYRIVEFALGLEPRFKIASTWTKWVLRKAAEDVLPKEVAWRRSKMGYPTPMARWFRQEAEQSALADLLFSRSSVERGVFAPGVLQSLWQTHQQGHDHSWLLYRAATLELWFRHFIDELAACPAQHSVPARARSIAA